MNNLVFTSFWGCTTGTSDFTCAMINPPKEGMRGNCYFPETFTSIPACHLEFDNILVVTLE